MKAGKPAPAGQPPMIYLRAPNGHVLGMTEPLEWAIEDQWEKGRLVRVNEDGSPFGGPVLVAAADLADPHIPPPPAPGAHKQAWADYAVKAGHVTAAEASGMTKPDLIRAASPDTDDAES
jgi:hypothetical protein